MAFSSFLTCAAEIIDHIKDVSGFLFSIKDNRFCFSVSQKDKEVIFQLQIKKTAETDIFK